MTSLLANIDPAFKTLAPRAADWLSILPEIAVAGLALLCLLQALVLPPAQRWLQPATARVGLLLVLVMSLTDGTPWNLPHDAENFPASFFTGADGLPAFHGLLRVQLENSEAVRLVFLACALGTSLLAGRFLRDRGVAGRFELQVGVDFALLSDEFEAGARCAMPIKAMSRPVCGAIQQFWIFRSEA